VFKEKKVGETPAADATQVIGRRVEVPLVFLTDNFEKYYWKIKLKINKVDGTTAFTIFDGLECTQDYLSRITRKGTSKIEVIQDNVTKDGIKLRVKSVLVTNRRVKTSIIKEVRKTTVSIIAEEVEKSTLDEFLKKLIGDVVSKRIMNEVSKIYPLRYFVVRRIDVLSNK